MESKSIYELGILAQKGNDEAMLEIIKRKTPMLKKWSFKNEDLYQFLILKIIEGIKNYNFFKTRGEKFEKLQLII